MELNIDLPDEAATQLFGETLAGVIDTQGGVILLEGDLGAGKTTLVRATVHALGYPGRVVSPSYTLIEPYPLKSLTVYHLDLYRLADPEELEFLGIRDMDPVRDLILVEWPSHGRGMLPDEDLCLRLLDSGSGRRLEAKSSTEKGRQWLLKIQFNYRSVG